MLVWPFRLHVRHGQFGYDNADDDRHDDDHDDDDDCSGHSGM